MKVLLIEDDQNKLKQLMEYIHNELPYSTLTEKRSYQSGLQEVLENEHQLLILDMTMPTFDISPDETGGRLRPFGGKEILRQMERRNVRIPVILVTQFEKFGESPNAITLLELQEELKRLYNQTFLGTVYYNASLDNWKTEFRGLLEQFKSI